MARQKQTTLPDSEYLMLADERDQLHALGDRLIIVPGPDLELVGDQHDRDAALSRSIAMRRLQRLRELRPEPDPAQPRPMTLWQDRRFRLDPSLVSPVSYFYGPPPQPEINYDYLGDFAAEPSPDRNGNPVFWPGSYKIVSREWKDAIEALEPGVHEFFPHTVEFANYTVNDHFIFRDALAADFTDYAHSDQKTAVASKISEGKRLDYTQSRPKGLAAKRGLMAGRHWARQLGVDWPVVSRDLASTLLPLLPDTLGIRNVLAFIPVILV